MDWLTFISNIIDSVAWPIALFGTVVLLRKPISKAIGLISKVKVSEIEVDFQKELTVAKEEASIELPPDTLVQASLPSSLDEELIKLAQVSPRAAVMESWRHVETAALHAAKTLVGADSFRNKTITFQAIHTLEKSGAIPERIVDLLRRLRSLRNQAAHAPQFSLSADSAIEYAQLAKQLVAYLQGLAHKP